MFTITLPLEAAPPRPSDDGCPSRLPAQSIRPGLRVLVVDDDDDTREALRLILKQSGIDVEAAASASEALERLAPSRPDVLLSDIAMPGEDGLALIGRVRALPVDRAAPSPRPR